MTSIALGIFSFCFALVFWAAGRETGSAVRRRDFELAYSCTLPFVIGLTLGTAVLALLSGTPMVFIPWALDMAMLAFGFFLGKCGFG